MMITVAVAAVAMRWPRMSLILFGLYGGPLIGGALAWRRSVVTLIASATFGGLLSSVGIAAILTVDWAPAANGRTAWEPRLDDLDRAILYYAWLIGAGVGCILGGWMAIIRSLIRERRRRRLREDEAMPGE